jgi:pyruvoyl-dependent arginine decarboxylase (PvlArgDC)
MTEKQTYSVLNPDQVFVAGERVLPDRTVWLTADQARYELLAGTILSLVAQGTATSSDDLAAGAVGAAAPSKARRPGVEG